MKSKTWRYGAFVAILLLATTAHAILDGEGGPYELPTPPPDWSVMEVISGANLGYSVSSAGDVNNDGWDDVIVGAPYLGNGVVFVYYGSELAQSPTYDVAAVLDQSRRGFRTTEVKLGKEIPNPVFAEAPGLSIRKLLDSRLVLIAAICLVVVVLTLILLRAARGIDRISGDEG